MESKNVIVWFRQDLRLHDNEALTEALEVSKDVLPVYVFDERTFGGKTRLGFPKTGAHRARFIIESVRDLRDALRAKGTDLLIRVGKPEEEIYEIAREWRANWVFCNRERTQEEVEVQDRLEQNLWGIGREIRYSRGKMLYYTADLPFPISQTPDTFSAFRKEVEKIVSVRAPLPVPERIPAASYSGDYGEFPGLQDFGLDEPQSDARAVLDFKGGETAALERLRHYVWETQSIKKYKETRNGLLGADYSSKFSPWLAQGCLSPKKIYAEVKAFEEAHGANDSTYWMFFELLWRDFFRLMGKKHGNAIFQKGGIRSRPSQDSRQDWTLFNTWREGRTGIPFIDANMREIDRTGFMSNRGRQNVASFLVKDLKVDWRMGAEYFESQLLDYDPCSNWGNWNYIAGVGSDPRENRCFNIIAQARRYDPDGEYVRQWLPELKRLPSEHLHTPDCSPQDVLQAAGITLGADYPKAMLSTSRWTS